MADFPKIVPLPARAPRAAFVTPQPQKDYFPQVPGCTEIGGKTVDPEKKCVRMSADEAAYWIDQGALGEQAGEHSAGDALGKTKQ